MVEIDIHKYFVELGHDSNDRYVMVTVTPEEALEIIISLSNQILTNNPNSSRAEHHCQISGDVRSAGGFFSINVASMEDRKKALDRLKKLAKGRSAT